MKLLKIYLSLFSLLSLFMITSCEKLDHFNDNPNAKDKVSSNFVLTYVLSNLGRNYGELAGYNSAIAGTLQYTQAGTNFGAAVQNHYQWDRGSWSSYYDILRNIKVINDQSQVDGNKFFEGISLTLRAFVFGTLTDLFGDVPYSESLMADEGQFFPKYDDQKDIYQGILNDLKEADNIFSSSDMSQYVVQASSDILYGGDAAKWQKFANSLRLRYAMRLLNKKEEMKNLGVDIVAEFNDASAKAFTSNDDNAFISYLGTTGSNAAPGGKIRSSNPPDEYKPSKTIADTLRSLKDPRMDRWFRPVKQKWSNGVSAPVSQTVTNIFGEQFPVQYIPVTGNQQDTSLYVGLPNGLSDNDVVAYNSSTNTPSFDPERSPYISVLSTIYFDNENELVRMDLISYSEVEFLLSEAAERGIFSVSNAELHYENGIKASFNRWGIGDGVNGFSYSSYLQEHGVDLNQASDKIARIMEQKWISGWLTPEPWFDWRRTGLPDFVPGKIPAFGPALPLRFMYPTPSQDPKYLVNYDAAVDKLEATQYVPSGQSKDHNYSKIWLLQGTGLPY